MKISDLFAGGSTLAQNRKRRTFYAICITLALLAVMLTVLAAIGIATLIADKAKEASEQTEQTFAITNTEAVALGEDALYSGTVLTLDEANRYKGKDTTVAIRSREGRPKTATGANVYVIISPSTLEDQDFRATPEAIDAFNSMMKEFYSAKQDDNICIVNAYSKSNSDTIFPIYSAGTAFELGYYFDYNADQSDIRNIYGVKKYEWIYLNAHKYGFINVRSADGSGSGVFRYVGVPHATYMNAKKIDFNTYLEQLRAATPAEPLLIKIGRITYASYFISASGEHLVPTDYEYTVSGNNYDGYIITATINESKINK